MKEKIVCAVSYLWILFFLPLILLPGNKFGKFHANQAALNFLAGIVLSLVSRFLGGIPVLGLIIVLATGIISLAMFIWGVYNALTGKENPYPFIGHITLFK